MLMVIWIRLRSVEDNSVSYGWMVALSVLTGLSLVIDAIDVVRYVTRIENRTSPRFSSKSS